jgi:uncharacterized membrane protein HdeD (DUF308 family)
VENNEIQSLNDIRKMMEQSSRLISLSGISGIAAGLCALLGAGSAYRIISNYNTRMDFEFVPVQNVETQLFTVAIITFIAAVISAFLFTYRKSKQDGTKLWGIGTRNLLWYTAVPLFVGAVVCIQFLWLGAYRFIAPCSLIFYGLGLVSGSKYTLGEVRYLGYLNIILGLINLFMPKHSLLFWTLGFGIAHVVYGIIMWMRYERK